jgi:hypothetical protein
MHGPSPCGTGLLSVGSMGSGVFGQQARGSKYLSRSAKKRLVLTTKRAGKGFYKGNGSTKEGYLTTKGKFVVDRLRRLELVVPDLTGFKVLICAWRFLGKCQFEFTFACRRLLILALVCLAFSMLQLKPYIAASVSRFPPEDQHNPIPR